MVMVGTRSEQQQRVYDAEEQMPRGRQFANVTEAQAYVDALTASDWWAPTYPDVERIDVVAQRAGAPSVANPAKSLIALTVHGLCERVVLHEVAHIVEPQAGHTAPWVRANMVCTYHARGSEVYVEMLKTYQEFGVDVG